MVVNDVSGVVSELCHNSEHHLRSPITLLQLSIMLLESSIIFLENLYSKCKTHEDRHMMIVICFIVQATGQNYNLKINVYQVSEMIFNPKTTTTN
jgi:hypothetical protein